MGSNTGSSGPTVQQQQLETQQATTSAQLNLEENAQRKSILNAMLGTRVFRGSALSRAVRGNTPGTGGEENAPAPSKAQRNSAIAPPASSLIDDKEAVSGGSGSTAAGGTGASGGGVAFGGGRYGGGSGRGPTP